ncbi:hypothetical protein Bpfe_016342 [Biomphalaria pfeifferi]|uniref:Uncharacterized protein n=1 Tax=Biomphalaria pfeifferi TaxID=112525 RepID=A0AAD8BHV8_BIOPF|nr:hypothetical protein Bpfe_016342 [Biomphalaria pfeifferi]
MGRASDAQRLREKNFEEKSRKLFDIAHQEPAQLIKIHEDRVFLKDQRSARQMKMSGIDKQLSKKEDRAGERKHKDEDRQMREEHRKNASAQSSITQIPDSSNSESEENIEEQQQHKDKDYEIEIPLYYKKQLCYAVDVEESSELDIATKKPRILQDMLSSSDVASALDRINLSDRNFTILAAAIAQASGQSLDDAALSRSTVHRKRLTHRSVIESHVREQFLARDKTPLLVHWGSKIMKDTTNNTDSHSNTDRVAVVVTGCNTEKILGITKIASGTGQAQANATYQLLNLWELSENIIDMCFDTTASNTELFWLALFSNKVANTEKKMMVEAMIAAGSDASVRGIKFPPANVEQLKRTQLHELLSSTTTAALLSIGLDVALLNGIDPEN